jgi:hypothetical protein
VRFLSDPGSLSRERLLVYQAFFVSSFEHSSHGIKCAHECPHAKYSSTHILKTNCGRWRPILEVPVEHPTVPTSANNRASSAAKPAVTRPILPCLPSHPILPMKYHHVVPMTRKIPNSSPEGSPPTHCQRHSQKVDGDSNPSLSYSEAITSSFRGRSRLMSPHSQTKRFRVGAQCAPF